MAMESHTFSHPTGPSTQVVVRALCSAAFATTAIVVVLFMRIGPVVLTLAPGRGIHTGDSLGLMSAAAALFLLEPLLRVSSTAGTNQVGPALTPS